MTWFDEYYDGPARSGPGMHKWRHYFPIYERHFAKYVGREVHILEVGIFSGGSLRMWHNYFGDQCHVYGVDIQPDCKVYEAGRTKVLIGNQEDRSFWNDVAIPQIPRLDIIVDDGSHQCLHQIATLECLLPHLSPGGVYLCEDVYGLSGLSGQFNGFHEYLGGLARNFHEWDAAPFDDQAYVHDPQIPPPHVVNTNRMQRHIDSLHLYPFCAVIETRTEPLAQLLGPRRGTEWQPF